MGCLAMAAQALAVPADPTLRPMPTPDGDSLHIRLVGDEYYHFTTTADGYTLVRDARGYYTYAQQDASGALVATGMVAHDQDSRDASEQALVATLTPRLTDAPQVQQAQSMRRATRHNGAIGNRFDYEKFRGLVVLINYSDVQFSIENPREFYDAMCNEDGFTGFTDYNGAWRKCPGSVHDYYKDNSGGIFQPQFDVVGPVTVPHASTEGCANSRAIFQKAMELANDSVDFSQYDTDGDGYIDMVFFIVAGYTSNYSGNDDDLLWPHMTYLVDSASYRPFELDGKYSYLMACSGERYGWQGRNNMINGIGVICHEFSHVLGLPDLYDTDYSGSGGQSNHPGDWDVMAGGSYFNYGRTPVGYTGWERFILGFNDPNYITEPGEYSLSAVGSTGECFVLPTLTEGEYFILDNRQKSGWDAYIPGSGMIIAHVDETTDRPWRSNTVNCDPSHNYYLIVRAGNGSDASASDPFPGSTKNTYIDDSTDPNLNDWDDMPNDFGLYEITESGGVVSFVVRGVTKPRALIEDFERMAVNTGTTNDGVQGNFATWKFTQCNVQQPEDTTLYNGERTCAMYNPSIVQMTSDITLDTLFSVSAQVGNPTAIDAQFKLYYSLDEGSTWTEIDALSAPAGEVTRLTWKLRLFSQPFRIRLSMYSGNKSKNNRVMIDDITFNYRGSEYEIPDTELVGDVNLDGKVDAADIACIVNIITGYDAAGTYGTRDDVNGDGKVDAGDISAVANIIAGE